MNWTVLGASGVIGRHLVARLRAAGETVFTPGRGEDILHGRPLGHVIYAIGLTADFRQRPFDTVQAHVSLLAEVLQHANFESLLYLSSTRVYEHAAEGREDAWLPVQAQNASDLYNLSKLMGESLCMHGGRGDVRVARLSNVVGGDDADSDNFVPSLVRAARAGRIVLRTALDSAKDYVHIDDVVELLPRIATEGREQLYNVASGVQTTHAQWVEGLTKQTGCVLEVASDAPVVHFAPIDIRRIRAEFDFEPRLALSALLPMVDAF